MPVVYNSASAVVATTFATHATPNTEIDAFFIKPATATNVRNLAVIGCYVVGRGAGLTAISGIVFRFAKFPTTASSAGTAITPTPRDPGMQAALASAGAASAGVTSGTGTKVYYGAFGCGAAGPGGWVAPNPDAAMVVQGAATQSLDLFSASATASLNYEFSVEHME